MAVEYSDDYLTCDADGITIRLYYFPWGDKRLLYSEIDHAVDYRMTVLRGKWRIWGGDGRHWLNYDPKRPNKDLAFIIHRVGGWVRPVLTPSDPVAFRAVLEAHGVRIGA